MEMTVSYLGTEIHASYRNTCQLQSMSGTLLGIYMPQNVGYSISGMLPTMKCQRSMNVRSCLEMLGTYSTAGIHKTVRY